GPVIVGQSLAKNFTVQNESTVPVTISSINASSLDQYHLTLQSALPLTLPPNGSFSFTVRFAPNTVGASAAVVSIITRELSSPFFVDLTGTGVAPPDLTITKSANPNPVASGGTVTYTITVRNVG